MPKITINGITLDPFAQGPQLNAAHLTSDDSSGSNYILVQTSEPLGGQKRDELEKLGAHILEYAPDDTYLCRYEPVDLSPIRNLPYVTWANIYMQGFKIAPQLLPLSGGAPVVNLLSAHPLSTTLAGSAKTVDVVLHSGVPAEAVREKIAAAAGLDAASIKMEDGKARLTLQPQQLVKLAQVDEVHHVEEFVPPKLNNAEAIKIIGVAKVHQVSGFEGDGEIVAVCDTGFDKGSTSLPHPAFNGRVLKLYPLGRASANDPHGHGTHVSGSVLGDGQSVAMGGAQRGAAPKAKLVLQSVLDASGGLGGLPADLKNLFSVPYANDKAKVHTNSWGSAVNGRYTTSSAEVDNFVRLHRDCVILFSAGNEGIDRDGNGVIDARSIGSPATAKNCITVGASENHRPDVDLKWGMGWPLDYPVHPINDDLVADNPQGMAAFSSRGPTEDGRIKPDLVAPGTSILSALSRDASGSNDWGVSTDPLFTFQGGTSMATPLVAGCAALVREYFRREHQHSPSAALVKAMLINGARDLNGQYTPSEADVIPNFAEGFGIVDMESTVNPGAGTQLKFHDEDRQLATGEVKSFDLVVPPGAHSLKVTLVWTDLPGASLQNDLDLIVRHAAGDERHGNRPAGATDFDRANNVEQIYWTGIAAGAVQITVRAYRTTIEPQSFALVMRVS